MMPRPRREAPRCRLGRQEDTPFCMLEVYIRHPEAPVNRLYTAVWNGMQEDKPFWLLDVTRLFLRLFFGDRGSRRNMVPNSVSYCRAEPFKVPAAAPRPRGRLRLHTGVTTTPHAQCDKKLRVAAFN